MNATTARGIPAITVAALVFTWFSFQTAIADAATVVNADDQAYVISLQGEVSTDARLTIGAGQQITIDDQGIMRLEGQNATSTLQPGKTYYIRDGMFQPTPTTPATPATPIQSFPDSSGFPDK